MLLKLDVDISELLLILFSRVLINFLSAILNDSLLSIEPLPESNSESSDSESGSIIRVLFLALNYFI
jgi:hypothetical protein